MFPYENYMGIIKKRLKSGNLVFEQTVANIDEIRSVFLSRPQSELLYSSTFPNNCCLIDKKIVIIDDVEEGNIVSGYCLDFLSNLFDYPYPSQNFNIGIYKKSQIRVNKKIPCNKCVCIPHENSFFVIPFAHSQSFY